MRIRRRLLIPLIVLLLVAAVALIVTLRKNAPPEAARLLPAPTASSTSISSGFGPSTLPANCRRSPASPNTRNLSRRRAFSSSVISIRRLRHPLPQSWAEDCRVGFRAAFLRGLCRQDRHRTPDRIPQKALLLHRRLSRFAIYNIQWRAGRCASCFFPMTASRFQTTPTRCDSRHARPLRKLASPFAGPWLLRNYYRRVPLASLCFAILRTRPEMTTMGGLGSWSLLFPKQTVAVISARYLPAFQTAPSTFARSIHHQRRRRARPH